MYLYLQTLHTLLLQLQSRFYKMLSDKLVLDHLNHFPIEVSTPISLTEKQPHSITFQNFNPRATVANFQTELHSRIHFQQCCQTTFTSLRIVENIKRIVNCRVRVDYQVGNTGPSFDEVVRFEPRRNFRWRIY